MREALSDPEFRDLRVLRGSIFYPCNPPARHRERSGEAGGSVSLWLVNKSGYRNLVSAVCGAQGIGDNGIVEHTKNP